MRQRSDVFLEFKTKSSNVDHLLDMDPAERVVLAWSLNTPFAIDKYEQDTASLDERLSAAARSAGAGFLLAFHFDPMVLYPGHLEEYLQVLDSMMQAVPPERIAWISLGCFRYVPGFPDVMRVRFPDEEMTFPEMVPGLDGKYRYLKPKRLELYSEMMERIRQYHSGIFVYLCMEPDDLWYRLTGREYAGSLELEKELSDNLIFRFR
jgi:spore photoproduct lyase